MALLGGMQRQQLSLRTASGLKAVPALPARSVSRRSAVRCNAAAANAPAQTDELGFKKMREGIKEAGEESILTPRL